MPDKRMCYFIPVDAHVPGHGFRVSVVTDRQVEAALAEDKSGE